MWPRTCAGCLCSRWTRGETGRVTRRDHSSDRRPRDGRRRAHTRRRRTRIERKCDLRSSILYPRPLGGAMAEARRVIEVRTLNVAKDLRGMSLLAVDTGRNWESYATRSFIRPKAA